MYEVYDMLDVMVWRVGCAVIITAVIIVVLYLCDRMATRARRKVEDDTDLDDLCAAIDRDGIYAAIDYERDYQDERWGDEFDDKNTANDWCTYICRYATNAADFNGTTVRFREQMTKVAALAVAAIEATDRTGELPPRHYD